MLYPWIYEVPMARRQLPKVVASSAVPKRVAAGQYSGAFAEWLYREGLDASVLASELGITESYVRALLRRIATPGAKLRLKIQDRTEGEVRFDSW